ncbi:MAG: DUF3368 domain-containing protein [Candidatus Thermoplasmatota archaeon]|nr:DUF3368 domain-containing protein [Candidatus Thermoplasmatota archaeon]
MEIITDATVLSNFALVDKLDVLVNTVHVCTTEEVIEELKVCTKKGIFKFDVGIEVVDMSAEERLTFSRLRGKFGNGEASCLAVGMHKKLKILTDDFDARKFAQRIAIPVSGTIGVLVKAVEKGIISAREGQKILHKMIGRGFYSSIEDFYRILQKGEDV